MPAIGDQVATLENDHTAALALIDSLKADKAALETQLADMGKHVDDVKAMVENVASGALKMLQSVQVTARAIPAEVLAKVETLVSGVAAGVVSATTTAEALGLPAPPATPGPVSPHAAPVLTGFGPNDPISQDTAMGALIAPDVPVTTNTPAVAALNLVVPAAHPGFTAEEVESIGTAATKWAKGVEADVEKIPQAVDRMLHHSSAASTMIRRPVDYTMTVDHDNEGLPIFLRRDTVFQREGRPQT